MATPTALDLIEKALHLVGAKDPLEPATAQEAADGLDSLNALLDSWNTDRLFVYRIATTNYTWPSGAVSKTVGSGGDINITRPVRCEDSYVVDNGITYPVKSIPKESYDGIPLKGLSVNYPQWLYYDPAFPLGSLYLYPIPASNLALTLSYWSQFSSVAAITDTLSLPPGYWRALTYNLAVEIASEYGMNVPPGVITVAANSAGKVKRLNAPQPMSRLEVAYQPSRNDFSIYRGY